MDRAEEELKLLRGLCLCRARRRLVFGSAGAGNDLRGSLGFILPAEWFRPRTNDGPSGLRDAPRPFVLRANHLKDAIPEGASFEFAVHLFDLSAVETMSEALIRAAGVGLGPRREVFDLAVSWTELSLPLRRDLASGSVRVEFLSPTELKGHAGAGAPSFDVLVARARDRASSIRARYGPGPLSLDFAAMRVRARFVKLVQWEGSVEGAVRRSSRTGQHVRLAGFQGWAVYEGPAGEFLPLLIAAQYTGVGRHTVWGQGEIRVLAR